MTTDRTRILTAERGQGGIRLRLSSHALSITKGFILIAVAALGNSCAVLEAPVSPPALTPLDTFHVSTAGIEIDALPIRTWEQNRELFDDNLPAVGLLPLWVGLRNKSGSVFDLGRTKWELRRGSERLRPVDVDHVFKQYYRGHKTRAVSVNSDRNAHEALSKWILNPSSLPPLESQQGFLFFSSKVAQPNDWNKGAILVVDGLAAQNGNREKRARLELPLSHANP